MKWPYASFSAVLHSIVSEEHYEKDLCNQSNSYYIQTYESHHTALLRIDTLHCQHFWAWLHLANTAKEPGWHCEVGFLARKTQTSMIPDKQCYCTV